MEAADRTLGVILAGGANRRYGSHKALARIGRRSILERTIDALVPAVRRTVIVANQPEPYRSVGLSIRPDLCPGLGVLGGILTAVRWAEEEGYEVALILGCDMPFLPTGLLRRIAEEADGKGVTLPASDGPRGFEPLCGAYGTGTGGEIERILESGRRAIVSIFESVPLRILEFGIVSEFGDPATMFLNVNRPEDRERAERIAAGSGGTTTHGMQT